MRINLLRILVVTVVFNACNSVSPNQIIRDEYKKFSDSIKNVNEFSEYLFFNNVRYVCTLRYNDNKSLRTIDGQLMGRSYGHFFKFDTYGTFDKCEFRTGNANYYNYGIRYLNDSLGYSEVGTPFVDYWVDESQSSVDSIKVHCYFSTFPRKHLKVFGSSKGGEYTHLNLEKSTMPFLESFSIQLPSTDKMFYFRIEASNIIYPWKGLTSNKIFIDSLSL